MVEIWRPPVPQTLLFVACKITTHPIAMLLRSISSTGCLNVWRPCIRDVLPVVAKETHQSFHDDSRIMTPFLTTYRITL
ncbi:hypothetical protein ACROYT_G001962 [Oculina patagonica]